MKVGRYVKQSEDFSAFIPYDFPILGFEDLSKLTLKAAEAERYLGKLDGVTLNLPDLDFFLEMFVAKDAESSSQIEGTQATMVEAIEKRIGVLLGESDADDIIFYIKALHYGLDRMSDFPISLRFIKELHQVLMQGARASHNADPGNFRKTQNWIGGRSPSEAKFVPPPAYELGRCLGDLEKFIYDTDEFLPLVKIALIHAQFETIHPFLDGNGRAGRILITLLLDSMGILDMPVLFLSSYFKKHQDTYYEKLNGYHEGSVLEWVDFFLDGIIDIANESIEICKKIIDLRKSDMMKIQALGKREAESGVIVLQNLFKNPILTSTVVMEWTGFTRSGAQKVIDRFVDLGILQEKNEANKYGKVYLYSSYLDIFI